MCDCNKRKDITNDNQALLDLKKQREEFVAAQLMGDTTVAASITFIDNVVAMYAGNCSCKSAQ